MHCTAAGPKQYQRGLKTKRATHCTAAAISALIRTLGSYTNGPCGLYRSWGASTTSPSSKGLNGAASCLLSPFAQVVQNALWNATLPGYDFPFRTAAAGAPLYQNIGDPTINREVNAIWLMVAVESAITMTFFVLALALLVVPAVQACRQGTVSGL